MCAYNAGERPAGMRQSVPADEDTAAGLGFKGYVTSDCAAITDISGGHKFSPDLEHASVEAVRAGTDTSCGEEFATLAAAVKDGLISEAEIDASVRRLFTARIRLGLFDPPSQVRYDAIPMSAVDSAEHRALSLRTAEEAIVLLKNDGTLPLAKSVKTIAVVGPNAASLAAIEGNYNAVPSHPVLPLNGMEKQFGAEHILYTQGSPYAAELPVPAPRTLFHPAMTRASLGCGASTSTTWSSRERLH